MQDLTKNPGRFEPRHPGKIDRRFGMTGTPQHATVFCPQRKYVAGLSKIVG